MKGPDEEAVRRPRLLVLGRKNSGKTSLINLVLGRPARNPFERKALAESPDSLPPGPGAPEGPLIHQAGRLADFYELLSPGPGAAARRDCLEGLENQLDEAEEDGRRPHLAWLCLDAARGRFTRLDRDLIEVVRARRLPLALVLTKADRVSAAQAEALIELIRRPRRSRPGLSGNLNIAIFESSLDPALASELGCPDRLLNWSLSHLGGSRRAALAGAAQAAIKVKARLGEECAARYAKAAALAGLSPLPLMDLAILVPIQTTMLTRLSLIWNLHADASSYGLADRPRIGSKAIEPSAGESPSGSSDSQGAAKAFPPLPGLVARCASTLGRMLAGNLLKLWPGAGMLVGGLINVGVAGLMTWGLGRAVNKRLEKYARLALSGQAPPPEDFWDLDALVPLVELYAQIWEKYTNGGP